MKPTQLAINSISTRGPLEETLSAYHDAGFSNVEFFLGHVKEYLAGGHDLAAMGRLLDENHLHFIGGFETQLEAFSTGSARTANHDRIVENAKLIAELGGSALVVGTDGPGEGVEDALGVLAAAFAEVGQKIAGTGVSLCIEFNWSPIVKSLRTAAEVARRSGVDNVGVLFDPAHYHCTPSKFEQLTPETVHLIKHVHVNNMQDKPGELSNCNSDRVLPGEGCLDLKALFGQIERHGYEGYFSIEMFSEELWSMPVAKAAIRMYDSLKALCE